MEITLIGIIGPALVIGLRVSGLMIFAPFFGSVVIPPRIKAVLTVLITTALYPVYASRLPALQISQWPVIVASEVVVGLGIGLAASVVFEAATVAGQVLSMQMGYSLVNILDPNTQVESTVVALFHQSIAMFLFLGLDVHHWFLRAVARSLDYLPPGSATLNPLFLQAVLHEGAAVLALGIQIAAPVLSATLLTDLALGLLGKASPQMPLMLLGPAVKSMLGVLVLGTVIRYWPGLFERYFSQSVSYMEHLLHLAR
jgi:flagellar biosynthetic protein FliR